MEIGVLSYVVGISFFMLLAMFLLRYFKQPHVISYILVGVCLGPGVLDLIPNSPLLNSVGDLGVILLLFFIGMHISLPSLAARWKVAVIGTLLQVTGSVLAAWVVGYFLGWPFHRILLLGFVISLSSTAIILKLLEEWGELKTRIGQDVVAILLVQDVLFVGMVLSLNFLSPNKSATSDFLLPIVGGLLVFSLVWWVMKKGTIKLRLLRFFKGDHELELVAALLFCFGCALLSGIFGLSTALGAFVAGIMLSAGRENKWVHDHLYPLQILLVAFFFIYVGVLLDVYFFIENWRIVLGFVLAVLLTNTFINAVILRLMGRRWKNALYGGALLSQVGEFSFLLAAVGLQSGFIQQYGYQMTIAIIAVGLLITPIWILLMKKVVKPEPQ